MRSEYTVIRAESVANLVQDVNTACQEGWHPHGGLVVIKDYTSCSMVDPVFYQPMVRESEIDARAFRAKMAASGRASQMDAGEFEKRVRRVLKNELGVHI